MDRCLPYPSRISKIVNWGYSLRLETNGDHRATCVKLTCFLDGASQHHVQSSLGSMVPFNQLNDTLVWIYFLDEVLKTRLQHESVPVPLSLREI